VDSHLSEQRRRQITDAAMRAITRSGVESTRILDVADDAGVSAGMIQHYFRSRDALMTATFRRFFDEERDEWTALVEAEDDPLDKLRAMLGFIPQRMPARELYAMWMELHAAATRDEDLARLAARTWGEWQGTLERIISAGAEAGVFSPSDSPTNVAVRLVALFDGLVLHVVLGHDGMTLEDLRRHSAEAAARELSVPVERLLD
jgi:AcrR family transcriptional regulator